MCVCVLDNSETLAHKLAERSFTSPFDRTIKLRMRWQKNARFQCPICLISEGRMLHMYVHIFIFLCKYMHIYNNIHMYITYTYTYIPHLAIRYGDRLAIQSSNQFDGAFAYHKRRVSQSEMISRNIRTALAHTHTRTHINRHTHMRWCLCVCAHTYH